MAHAPHPKGLDQARIRASAIDLSTASARTNAHRVSLERIAPAVTGSIFEGDRLPGPATASVGADALEVSGDRQTAALVSVMLLWQATGHDR